MLVRKFGNVTIDFRFVIAAAIIILVSCAIGIIRAIMVRSKLKKLIAYYYDGNYDAVIPLSKELMDFWGKTEIRRSLKTTEQLFQNLNFVLAVAYFSKSDDENFLKHINAITNDVSKREFWLSLYYLRRDDIESAQIHVANIEASDETNTILTFFEGYLQYKQGDIAVAREKMQGIYEQLQIVELKRIAAEIINQ